MPKVFLTEAQRIENRYARRRNGLAECLAVTGHREKLNKSQMSKRIGINHGTYAKLMDGEDVKLSTTTWLRLMDLAGIDLKELEVKR